MDHVSFLLLQLGWAPIPLKPNMCSLCGHSMVFHDDDDVAAVSVHQGHNTLEQRKKEKEAELAPLKRKSVVQLYAPLFEGKKEEVRKWHSFLD